MFVRSQLLLHRFQLCLDGQTPLPTDAPTQNGGAWQYVCTASELAVVTVSGEDLAGNAATATLTFADVSIAGPELTLSAAPNYGYDVTAHAVIRSVSRDPPDLREAGARVAGKDLDPVPSIDADDDIEPAVSIHISSAGNRVAKEHV